MESERLASACQEQLKLVLSFFSRVDAKSSVLLAVDTGMLGYLATHIPSVGSLRSWELVAPALAFVLLGLSLVYLYRGAFPALSGGQSSLVYFSEIAQRTEAKFIDQFIDQRDGEYVKDLLGQVWRNSEILKMKFSFVKTAFIFMAWAVLPWTVALASFAVRASANLGQSGK
jgi:hypothetical protein